MTRRAERRLKMQMNVSAALGNVVRGVLSVVGLDGR